MCEREKSLGEEIIDLVGLGVETNVVERMYRKYIDLCTGKKENVDRDITTGKSTGRFKWGSIAVGDKIEIPLGSLGILTATAHKVVDNRSLFIFDDCITARPMNKTNTNMGGYENSDLKRWIDTELYSMFPDEIRKRMSGLSIPTLGEVLGWGDAWNRGCIEPDGDEQLPLMKQFTNECEWFWLRNATKAEWSSTTFAYVVSYGYVYRNVASNSGGVRPEFWLEI